MSTVYPYKQDRNCIYIQPCAIETHERIKVYIDKLPADSHFNFADACQMLGVYSTWDVLNSLDHWTEEGLLIETSVPDCVGQHRTWHKPPPAPTERLRGLSL